jgi:alanyl aminopeptidase
MAALLLSAQPKLRLAEVEDVSPIRYQATLDLDPAMESFSGAISIQTTVRKPVTTLWLNASKIAVKDASAIAGGKTVKATAVAGGDDFLGLQFESPLPVGNAEIRVTYTGEVRRGDSAGIFYLKDKDSEYLFTQFENTDARDAFPCFDEPGYKTPWQVTLRVPKQDSAVSNTPGTDRAEGAVKVYTFKETKPIPSYLVAFAVGPFEYVDGGVAGKNKVPVRIVTPKGRSVEAKYAAEISATVLTRLEDYFGIPFPYEKLDQVSVPITGGFGAMENAGMVTYGQTIILADPASDTLRRQRSFASDAAHELAHQWFGDLVTTGWWDDIWLNEAFATWMEQKLVAQWKPEWKTRVEDVDSKLLAEDVDSLVSTRKIRQPILTKDDIVNAFDAITYQKGAAVIGMFESWMGEEEFRKGVHSYLNRYAFRTATAGDFLDSLVQQEGRRRTVLHVPQSGRSARRFRHARLRQDAGGAAHVAIPLTAGGVEGLDEAGVVDALLCALRRRAGGRMHGTHEGRPGCRAAEREELPHVGGRKRRRAGLLSGRLSRRLGESAAVARIPSAQRGGTRRPDRQRRRHRTDRQASGGRCPQPGGGFP